MLNKYNIMYINCEVSNISYFSYGKGTNSLDKLFFLLPVFCTCRFLGLGDFLLFTCQLSPQPLSLPHQLIVEVITLHQCLQVHKNKPEVKINETSSIQNTKEFTSMQNRKVHFLIRGLVGTHSCLFQVCLFCHLNCLFDLLICCPLSLLRLSLTRPQRAQDGHKLIPLSNKEKHTIVS